MWISTIRSILRLILAFAKKITNDGINVLSAHTAFFVIISFFPFVMFLLTLLSFFPFFTDVLSGINLDLLPSAVSSMIVQAFTDLSFRANGAILSVTVILALWSASRGFLSIMNGLNRIYNIQETRNYYLTRLLATGYTIVFALLLLIMMVIFVFGNQLMLWFVNKFPLLEEYALIVISVRTTVGIGILIFFFLLIYISLPNRRTSLLRELPGAVICAVGWVGFSFLFSYYVDNFSNYAAIYGSLTAIVLCMLWLYACMFILFVGAEINAILCNSSIRKAALQLLNKSEPESPSPKRTKAKGKRSPQ